MLIQLRGDEDVTIVYISLVILCDLPVKAFY